MISLQVRKTLRNKIEKVVARLCARGWLAVNGQSLLLCWYFLMSSPEPLLIEKLMMKITTHADRIPSAGYGLIAILKLRIFSSASIAANSLLAAVFISTCQKIFDPRTNYILSLTLLCRLSMNKSQIQASMHLL